MSGEQRAAYSSSAADDPPPLPPSPNDPSAYPPRGDVVTDHDVERDEFGRCVGCLYSAGHALDCPLRPQAADTLNLLPGATPLGVANLAEPVGTNWVSPATGTPTLHQWGEPYTTETAHAGARLIVCQACGVRICEECLPGWRNLGGCAGGAA